MLRELNLGDGSNLHTSEGKIALDCSVRETRQGHVVISTTDFFFPLVDSPYLQGRIGAANVLSDLYAEGVPYCDFVLMLLAACQTMPEEQRRICTTEMVKGFRDACAEAGTAVTGGQTVLNPWPIIGGVATSIVAKSDYVPSDGAKEGDVLVLTKPLGTQVAVNVHQWKRQRNHLWDKCSAVIDEKQAEAMMHQAVCSMARLNKEAGRLMLHHGAHACTDVTGFGILGHAQSLIENQRLPDLGLELEMLPCIAGTRAVNDRVFDFRLTKGYSAETSGGLLICLPPEKVEAFQRDLLQADGKPSWIIGKVVSNPNKKAVLKQGFQVMEVY